MAEWSISVGRRTKLLYFLSVMSRATDKKISDIVLESSTISLDFIKWQKELFDCLCFCSYMKN